MTYSDIVYPNQPLVEVVFEIRFPGDLIIECEKNKFWNLIRDEYPNILVPQSQPDQALALLPYKFRKADGSMTVMVALNSFAISVSKYPGYKVFEKEILRIFELFQSVYQIEKLNRVGWRYINIIQFVRENNVIPLDKFLTIGFKIPSSIPEKFTKLNLTFESLTEDGASIITDLQTIEKTGANNEALLLDFDYGRMCSSTHQLISKKVPEYLAEAHDKTRQLFEDFITDEYRQYLKGDVI